MAFPPLKTPLTPVSPGESEPSRSLLRREALEGEALVAEDTETLPSEAIGQPQPEGAAAPQEVGEH